MQPGEQSESQARETLNSSSIFEALHAIAIAVGGLHDPLDLARVTGEHAQHLVGADGVDLHLWDEELAVLQPLYSSPSSDGLPPSMQSGQGAAGQAFQQRQAVLVQDYPNWEHALAWALEHGVRQIVSVPLLVAERAIGALVVRFGSPSNCTPEHAEVLALVAAQLAPALEAAVQRARADQQSIWLAATLEHLPIGVVVLDAQGQVIALNAEGRRLSGAGPDADQPLADQAAAFQARGDRAGPILAPDQTAAARALRGEHVRGVDYLVRPPGTNEDLWMRVSAVPVRDADGRLMGAVSTFTDITRERGLLRELAAGAADNADLARELVDREKQLQERWRVLLPDDIVETTSVATLSARERQVLSLLARGETNRQIGDALAISSGTVRKHVEHILAKLKVTDRTQAAVRASELGLIEAHHSRQQATAAEYVR